MTHTRTALLLSLTLASTASPALRAGVSVVSSGLATLAIEGPALTVGSPVTLIGTDTRQEVYRAVIARRLAESPAMARLDIPGPYYEVATSDGRPLPHVAIAVVGRPAITRLADGVSLRVGAEYRDVRVRSCASHEGLHFTLWAGKPLTSRRLWHQYFYLGYDVEPDCQAADIDDKVDKW